MSLVVARTRRVEYEVIAIAMKTLRPWSRWSLLLVVPVPALGCGSDNLLSFSYSGSEGSASAGPEDEREGFVAHYFSAWPQAFMHFDDGSGWTAEPGVSMSAAGGGWFDLEHGQGTQVQFVFNDGAEQWDDAGGSPYSTELYEFWVKDGQVFDQRPDDGDTVGTPFCDEADCGEGGSCNEAEQRCDCDAGYIYVPSAQTCVTDACADVECGFGELCDGSDASCQPACTPDRTVGDFELCAQKTDASVGIIVQYQGAGQLDLEASTIRLGEVELPPEAVQVDPATGALAISASGLPPSKYSFLLRMRNDAGQDLRPLYVPQWLGDGMRYADFGWKDGIMYQIMTDRFLNGDSSNDIDNSQGTLAEVDDVRSQWQGGDFRGIIEKIKDGYFEDMGINALWISSPMLNSHNSQPAVGLFDDRRFSSYHSYHPITTGYTHLDDFGYESPIETAFGTSDELHELVREAHLRGIRVIPDFVANHVQSEAQIYADHPEWFFAYNPCDGNWDAHRIDCWFTTQMPDFDFGGNPQAVQAVVDHALWMIQEYDFDGFRADALKHMDDVFVRALKTAVIEEIETTVEDHSMSDEATVFYMVGESLGGWARYHVRNDMVQGQVDEDYYQRTKNALLSFNQNLYDLAQFAIPNDTAYLVPQPNNGGTGGYPGAVMGNFFGNHDQVRALTEAGGDHARLRLAQTFLFTSPLNIPMLYQGDDIGTFGNQDPDNRAMHRFDGLSADEQDSLEHARMLGLLREEHPALRRGSRQTEVVETFFWVYRVEHEGDVVYVALNRDADRSWQPPAGYIDALGNCDGGIVPSMSSCVFVAS